MSLLMDALKKAELAKRKAQLDFASTVDASTAEAPEPSAPPSAPPAPVEPQAAQARSALLDIEPLTPPPPVRPPADALEFEVRANARATEPPLQTARSTLALQSLDERVTPAPSASATNSAPQRESVKNLFESKAAPTSRKAFAIAIGVCTLLAIVAISIYFWMQLRPRPIALPQSQSLPSGTLAPQAAAAAANPSASPAAPPFPDIDPAASSAMMADSTEEEDEEAEEPPTSAPARRDADTTTAAIAPPATQKLFRSPAARPAANTTLDRAYDALRQGNDAQAKVAYEQALAADPKNVDALSGLAVIAQRTGNPGLAAEYYSRILDADPRNSAAQSGLINLQSRMSPSEAESRIKQSLATQPDSPALQFSLGNVYARSQRWNEAQQAYFNAVSGDPGNPDYLFNLAVSLDQLRQPKLAANYYAQAIAAAGNRPSSFDRAQAETRLQQLP